MSVEVSREEFVQAAEKLAVTGGDRSQLPAKFL
jgi:hypothetical protein